MTATSGHAPSAAAPERAPIALTPTRTTMEASRAALRALILRDLAVLRKNFGEFVAPNADPAVPAGVRVPLRVPEDRPGDRRRLRTTRRPSRISRPCSSPGVVGISIMFQGIQAVAMQMSTEFGYTREIEDRVQAPCPLWLVAAAKVLSGAVQGLIAALIVFPIAAVVHAPGVEAHLSFHWPIVITLIPLACVAMTCLGLLLGTTFEPRNIGLMFGFVVLPLTFLGGTYYQWQRLAPVKVAGFPVAADARARQPADLHHRGDASRSDRGVAHAAVRDLPGADRVLRALLVARAAQLQAPRPGLRTRRQPIGRRRAVARMCGFTRSTTGDAVQ